MSDAFIKAELTAACSSLGSSDGAKYHKEPHCLEALKDLIRYLRRDDETFTIRRELGDMKVIQTDLVPLMVEYARDKELFDVNLRLLVNLTNPTILLFKEEIPAERVTRNYYLQLVSQLQNCKEHLASEKLWTVLTEKLSSLLKLDWDRRLEDDRLVIERILILIRNILHIPADAEAEKRTDDDASIHDQVLWAMHLSGMDSVILYLASSDAEQNFCMHVLEIVSLMLREQNPQQLGTSAVQRTLSEKQQDEKELQRIRDKELEEKKAKLHKMLSSRHSRFGGTFVVKDLKSISDKDLITHKPIAEATALDFDKDKKPSKKPRNKLPVEEGQTTRRSTLSIRLFLKEFCVEFLTGAYNSLMFVVKDNLIRARTQEHDETYYLWAMKFFMEFNRHCKFRMEVVSETMSVQLFHYIQTQLETYADMIRIDKTKMRHWSRRMHLALKAYQELLMTLSAMMQSKDTSVRESAKVIQGNVFYVLEYRELCFHLLQTFDPAKHSKSYLKDLVETTHICLKLLEAFAKSSRHLVVQKKTVARRKKKAKKADSSKLAQEVAEVSWDEVSSDVSNILHGLDATELPNDVVPFDSASSVPIDDQKVDAIRRIQRLMKENKLADAVSLLRASRSVWPENDVFGAANANPDEEFLTLRDAFFAELPPGPDPNPTTDATHVTPEDDVEDELENEEDEEEETASVRVAEQELHFEDFVMRFAHHRVLQAYAFLLQQFATNSTFTNHCIVKMLHRVAWDCKLPAMLFQASVFRTFQKILRDKSCQTDASMKELAKFACFVIRKFTEIAAKNPKVYMELLFWKTAREAMEIEEGYGSYKEKTKGSKNSWSEEEEFQLEHLYEEFMAKNPPGGDAAEFITENLIGQTKSKRLVIKKMKALGLQTGSMKSGKFSRPPPEWAEEEIHQLKQLVKQHLPAKDPLNRIVESLTVQRPKNRVREKILELGLVSDAKLLRKKRSHKGRRGNASSSSSSSDEARANERSYMSSKRAAEEESSDDDAFDRLLAAHRPSVLTRQSENHPKENPPVTDPTAEVFSPTELRTMVQAELNKGNKEAFEWLVNLLEEEAGDRHVMSGPAEAVPVVPLSESAVTAMEDKAFLQILPSLGILPPADSQEQFWRIGADFSASALLSRADFLKRVLRGETNETEVEGTEAVPAAVGSGKRRLRLLDDSSDEERNNEQQNSQLSAEDETTDKGLIVESPTPPVRKPDGSDSDSDVQIRPKRPRMQIDSDSE